MSHLESKAARRLMEAFACLTTAEECSAFIEDLCTIKEIQDMAQRFETAALLDKKVGYQKIAEEIGVSTATISRVNRALVYGSGGYKMVIGRLEDKHADS